MKHALRESRKEHCRWSPAGKNKKACRSSVEWRTRVRPLARHGQQPKRLAPWDMATLGKEQSDEKIKCGRLVQTLESGPLKKR